MMQRRSGANGKGVIFGIVDKERQYRNMTSEALAEAIEGDPIAMSAPIARSKAGKAQHMTVKLLHRLEVTTADSDFAQSAQLEGAIHHAAPTFRFPMNAREPLKTYASFYAKTMKTESGHLIFVGDPTERTRTGPSLRMA